MRRRARRCSSPYTSGVSLSSAASSPLLQARSHPVMSSRGAEFMPPRRAEVQQETADSSTSICCSDGRLAHLPLKPPHPLDAERKESSMRCAFGVGVAILLWHAPLLSRAPTRVGDSARHRLMLNLTPFSQGTVRSAIDLALTRLAR